MKLFFLSLLTLLVESRDGSDSVVGERAEDLDDGFFVSAHPRDGIMKLLSIEVWEGSHQSHDHVLQITGELALQFADQVLEQVP